MKLPPIKPKVLVSLLEIMIREIFEKGESNSFSEDLWINSNGIVADVTESTLEKILNYLQQNKFFQSYEIDYDKSTPIFVIRFIKLKNIDYDLCNEYIKLEVKKLYWMFLADGKGKDVTQDFWFVNDVLYYHSMELELPGFQARLCEKLFDQMKAREMIEDSDLIEFITGEGTDTYDLKSLIKEVNKKMKAVFELEESVIRQKNGKTYRTL